MSDLRDFNTPPGEILSEDIRPVSYSEPHIAFADSDTINDDGLGEFHVTETEESSNTGRVVGALAVALLLGTAGIYAYESSKNMTPATTSDRVALAAPPAPAAAPPPDNAAPAAPQSMPDSTAPMTNQPASMPAPAKPQPMIRAARNESQSSDNQSADAIQAPAVTPSQVVPTPGLPNQNVGQNTVAAPSPTLANAAPDANPELETQPQTSDAAIAAVGAAPQAASPPPASGPAAPDSGPAGQ